ncbi:DNA-binding protein [Paracoccus ferrooxidans]|nr:DNA-binding protein [Paracoccus ferrooxidans]
MAERLGWPIARVRKLIRQKALRHMKIGGLYFVPAGAVEEYLAAQTVEPAAQLDHGDD